MRVSKGEREDRGKKPNRWLLKAAAALAGVLIICAAGYVYMQYISGNILPNVYVGGVSVGGMSQSAAEKKLSDSLGGIYSGKSLEILMDGKSFTVGADENRGVGTRSFSGKGDEVRTYGRYFFTDKHDVFSACRKAGDRGQRKGG
jgi:hypothetical protein